VAKNFEAESEQEQYPSLKKVLLVSQKPQREASRSVRQNGKSTELCPSSSRNAQYNEFSERRKTVARGRTHHRDLRISPGFVRWRGDVLVALDFPRLIEVDVAALCATVIVVSQK
jgi:hypothetical protein